MRCKIEKLHRALKKLTAREACQCRKALIKRNDIVCAILGWNFIKITVRLMGKTVDYFKQKLLSDYLKQELKNSTIYCLIV
jgi:hypothetical protein